MDLGSFELPLFKEPMIPHPVSYPIDDTLGAHAWNQGKVFRSRKLDVLRLMARGMSNKEIARALWIGEATVKTHVSHVLHKMGTADRTQAVRTAVHAGIVSADPAG